MGDVDILISKTMDC